ncbi:hypothetical protein HV436_01255 [Bacillus sporothermodurans]|uniref:hypothetical protein n=1 Tax=Heyndrickxia sporothermodurans TaxID=46224 RepID=UPI00192BD554|nr:hypothetical protein [Heyndrickxia sporothermodurans]MBL5776964.1 hypothetical protein [Heyndrickxia sporothermodurans]MBL5798491.1 hypothetical protein [Heyndrickxia sporothermodurans]MBL5809408.1 hypothetical protein [Heyndrickxia sporothermodurans]MBL5813043.1 hypothetical protein [Heyndrickxia sporothermodurans]MBL5816467.1 hypothetical protein [Heyndrickxia sporothermodurans]
MIVAIWFVTFLLSMTSLGAIIDMSKNGFDFKKFIAFLVLVFILAVFLVISFTGQFFA